jgi:hypothetical protein
VWSFPTREEGLLCVHSISNESEAERQVRWKVWILEPLLAVFLLDVEKRVEVDCEFLPRGFDLQKYEDGELDVNL